MSTTQGHASARAEALAAPTLAEAFRITAAAHPDRVALRTKGGAVSLTWAQYAARVRRIAAGLAKLGVGRGDTFGAMLVNRPEFHLVDTAAMHLGATCFSIYATSSPEQIAYLLGDAGNRVVVTEEAFAERLAAGAAQGGRVEHVLRIEELDALEASGDADFDLDAHADAIEADDVLCLIYTSGTTGPPKGVELTHANATTMVRCLDEVYGWPENTETISFLPHAHIADRGLNHYAQMQIGATITTCPDPKDVFAHVLDARPTVFGAVPRVWEKLKAALEAGFAAEADETRRTAVEAALAAGVERVRHEQRGEPVPDEIAAACARAEGAVFAPLREQLGLGRAERFMIGAAACPVEVQEFFAAIGIELSEVWGMSETAAVATINPPGAPRFGTVGKPVPGACEIRLAESEDPEHPDRGELLIRGPIVMRGYRNHPEQTAETFTDDGWMLTGDIAEWTDEGYLRLVDRKKELIINAAGKNMSPANIESHLKAASPLIGQAYVHGDGKPYNVALLVLDPDVAPSFEGDRDQEIAAAVARANERMSRVEQIKRWRVLEDEWLPGGDELTPTMKLKRKPIVAKYRGVLEDLYD